jgi:hypothetical protein
MTGVFGIRRAWPSPQATIYDFSRESSGCSLQPDRLTAQDSIFPGAHGCRRAKPEFGPTKASASDRWRTTSILNVCPVTTEAYRPARYTTPRCFFPPGPIKLRMSFRSPAQYRVKPYLVGDPRQAQRDQHLFGHPQGTLRVEDPQVAVHSLFIPEVR